MKKSALIKLLKEELIKKKLLKEGVSVEELVGILEDAIPDGAEAYPLGQAIAKVLYSSIYNKANQADVKFLEGFKSIPAPDTDSDTAPVNENQSKTLTKDDLINDLKAIPTGTTVGIPRVYPTGVYDKTGTTLRATPEQAIAALNSATEEAMFKLSHETSNYKQYSLVQTADALKKAEKVVTAQGLRDV